MKFGCCPDKTSWICEVIATEQQFGMVSDLLGVHENVPTVKLSRALMPDSRGFFLRYGALKTMPGASNALVDDNNERVQTPDENPVIHFHHHVSGQGVEYIFCYTKAHVYKWDETTKQYDTFFTCSSNCTMWSTVSFNNKVISTNNVDMIQVWDETTPGTVFAALDTASGLDLDGLGTYLTKAAHVIGYENYLIFGDTTEGGSHYHDRVRWSTGSDITDYDVNGAGDTGAKDFEASYGVLKGFGLFTFQGADILIIFKEQTYFPVWLVETDEIWSIGNAQGNIGLLATHSVVNDSEGHLYWIGNDYNVHQFAGGILSAPIDKTMKRINTTYQDYIEAHYIKEYNHLWWSIPSNTSSTGNDLVVDFNLNHRIWHKHPFSYRAFGNWSQQTSYTIDQLDNLAASIDGLDAYQPTIDYVEGLIGFPLDLVSDYSGYTYKAHTSQDDMNSTVTRYFVLSSMLTEGLSLQFYKRINRFRHYLLGRSAESTLTFLAKEDNAASWTSLGSISQESSREVFDIDQTPSLRCKHLLLRGETIYLCDYLGLFIDYTDDGEF